MINSDRELALSFAVNTHGEEGTDAVVKAAEAYLEFLLNYQSSATKSSASIHQKYK